MYPSEKIGKFVNDNFIAVKVQMDSTQQDDEQIRKWYSIGSDFRSQYNVTAFPTYLFFSPNGKIVSKHIGYEKRG